MEEKQLKDLKAGDFVIVTNFQDNTKLCMVEGITPKGFIKADKTLFDPKSGRERTSDIWRVSYCQVATEREIKFFKHKAKVIALKKFIKDKMVFEEDIEKLEKIKEILGG